MIILSGSYPVIWSVVNLKLKRYGNANDGKDNKLIILKEKDFRFFVFFWKQPVLKSRKCYTKYTVCVTFINENIYYTN